MNPSKKHHYIPEFLIKNFCDTDGLIYVYDKSVDRFIGKKSPASVFYELHRNTMDIGGNKSDAFEQLYSALDGRLGGALQRVTTTKPITPEDFMSMLLLASTLKWRVPVNDDTFNNLKETVSYDDLPVMLRHKESKVMAEKEIYDKITGTEVFRELKRVVFPVLPFLNEAKLQNLYENSFVNTSHEKILSILGDCPIIEKPYTDIYGMESFLFPLSSHDTLIYKNGTKKAISDISFFLLRDVATFHLSQKYVGCRNKEHLESIIKLYQHMVREKAINLALEHLFDFV
jgi:hypothetical protein